MTNDKQINAEDNSQLVTDYKWDELDTYYDKLIDTGTEEEKEQLAEAYISYFAQLAYDFACGKIAQGEVSFFLDIVSKAEALTGRELWYHKGVAYQCMMERSLDENELSDFFISGTNACAAYQKSIENGDEGIGDNYNAIALIFEKFTQYHPDDKLFHWQQGLQFLQHSISIDPLEVNWVLYLKLLYLHYPSPNEEIRAQQTAEKLKFLLQVEHLAESVSIYPVIAQAYLNFREHLAFYRSDESVFPQREYQDLLDKATLARPATLTYFSATDAGGFFHKEGARLGRIDMLNTAIYYFEKTIGKQEDHHYGIRCVAQVYEDISQIHAEKSRFHEANLMLNRAQAMFTDNIAAIESDFSPVTFYASFLERCFHKDWYKNKPALAEVKRYAKLSMAAGQGHYLIGPMILIRVLLLEHKEDEIIGLLTRELILHEKSLLSHLIELKNTELEGFPRLSAFIDTQINLFEQAGENYYPYPQIDWEVLNGMRDEQVFEAWESRKSEILNPASRGQ